MKFSIIKKISFLSIITLTFACVIFIPLYLTDYKYDVRINSTVHDKEIRNGYTSETISYFPISIDSRILTIPYFVETKVEDSYYITVKGTNRVGNIKTLILNVDKTKFDDYQIGDPFSQVDSQMIFIKDGHKFIRRKPNLPFVKHARDCECLN